MSADDDDAAKQLTNINRNILKIIMLPPFTANISNPIALTVE
jgi:hypothetical protein